MAATLDRHQGVDGLVNNAGASLLRTGEESFDIPHRPEQPDVARIPG